MTWVTDSSPLHYLVQIKAEHILPQLFTRLITPPEVIAELTHPWAPVEVRGWAAQPPSWLNVVSVNSSVMELGLGLGESAAIALAIEMQAEGLVIDDRAGTNAAKRLGLRVAGTLAVLAVAAEREVISLPMAFRSLRTTSFRAPEALMNGLLELDRERRSSSGRSG